LAKVSDFDLDTDFESWLGHWLLWPWSFLWFFSISPGKCQCNLSNYTM